MKKCTKCKKQKDKSEFHISKRSKDGLRYWCKQCSREYNKSRNNPVSVTNKVCSKCRKQKDKPEFYKDKYSKDGLNNYCKKCVRKYHRKYRRLNQDINYKSRLKCIFDITIEHYKKLFKQQKECCAICGSKDIGRKNTRHFSVDHDHKTGKIRGLLCHNCNAGLGYFKDDAVTLQNAIEYLEKN